MSDYVVIKYVPDNTDDPRDEYTCLGIRDSYNSARSLCRVDRVRGGAHEVTHYLILPVPEEENL